MPKFFMPVAELQPAFLTLTGENAAHAKVLRLKPGDTVTVCDGNGTDHTCTISDLSQGQVSLVGPAQRTDCRRRPNALSGSFWLWPRR